MQHHETEYHRHDEGHHAALRGIHARRRRNVLHQEHGDDDQDGKNVQRVGSGEIGEPEPVRLAQFDRILKHLVNGPEQRHLDEHGQAAAVEAYPLALVQMHHLRVHFLSLGIVHLEMCILALECVHFGLDAHHLQRRLHHHQPGGHREKVQHDAYDHNGPAPVVEARAEQVAQPAHRIVERLGNDGEHAEVDQRLERRPIFFPVRSCCVDGVEHGGVFRAGEEAQLCDTRCAAHGHAEDLSLFRLAVGLAGACRQRHCVMERDDCRVLRMGGQKGRGKVEIGDSREGVRRVERCAIAHLSGLGGIFLAVQRPGEVGSCRLKCNGACQRRLRELAHVAQAGGPGD